MKEKGFQLENYRRSSPDKKSTRLAAEARLLTKSITGFSNEKSLLVNRIRTYEKQQR